MQTRFRRRIKLFPGVTVNLGKRGASVSVGVRGAKTTFGRTGTRTTAGLPGTGLSVTHLAGARESGRQGVPQDVKPRSFLRTAFLLILVAWIAGVVILGIVAHT